MTFKSMVYMCLLFVLLPSWIGIIWVKLLKIEGQLECFCHAWIFGLVTMLAVGQLLLVPMILLERTLTETVVLFQITLTILAVISFCLVIREVLAWGMYQKDRSQTAKKRNIWMIVFGMMAAVLIFIQAFIPMKYQHLDDDDSRFISEEVSAVVHDTLLKDDPITADFMYWDVGEVGKDVISPWPMYVSICCKIAGIAPAVFSHTYFPFFMIIICYVLYGMVGRMLFHGDMEKTYLFLLFLSVYNIFDFTSTHTLSAMFLLRIWQGKAIVAGFLIPLLLYLFYRIFEQKKENLHWVTPLYAVSFAASLLSGMGIIIAPILLGIYGLLDLFYTRSFKRTLLIWLAAAPCGIYLIYSLMGI